MEPSPPTTFRPLDDDARRLHGEPALVVCGHTPAEIAELRARWTTAGCGAIPVIAATAAHADLRLGDLARGAARPSADVPAGLPRAVILSGIPQAALHAVMQAHRAAGLAPVLWAALTPTNERWTLQALLDELGRERQALGDATRRANGS